MDDLDRTRLHEALAVKTPHHLRTRVMGSLPARSRKTRWTLPSFEWARPWVAALLAIAFVVALIGVGRALGPQLVHKTPPRQISPAFVSRPMGMAVGPDGSFYFSDFVSGYVFRLLPNGSLVTVAGTRPDAPMSEGDAGNNGPATRANLFGPGGLAFDASGNLYIADTNANRIRKVDLHGVITTYAGTGPADGSQGIFGGDGGPAIAAKLHFPYGIAFDAAGNLYIADMGNHRVRRIDRSGRISSLDDSGLPIPQAQFHPDQLAFDASGDLFVLTSDWISSPAGLGCEILRRTPNGAWSVVAGTGVCGFGGDGGPATGAEISGYGGLVFDPAGNLYFSDADNGRIRRIDRSGIITTVKSGLEFPKALAMAPGGLIYVADETNGAPTSSGRPTSRISLLRLSDGRFTTVVDSHTPIRTLG